MHESCKIEGKWWVTLYGPDKEVKDYRHGKNVITNDGKSFLAGFLASAAAAASTFTMRYLAIGTNATAESATDVALGTELNRVSGTVSQVTGAIYRISGTFPAGIASGPIVEYGLFSTATTGAGTMFSRDTEAVINKGASDEIAVVTEVTFS